MKREPTPRNLWRHIAAGEDVFPVVSPLCDHWRLAEPYRWPFPGKEPFPPGHRGHMICEQIAMAEVCGWTPSFVTAIDFQPSNPDIEPEVKEWTAGEARFTEMRIRTPYGALSSLVEHKTTAHTIKHMLECENDYRAMAWLLTERLSYDEDTVISQICTLQDAIGDRGVLGTWVAPPISSVNRHQLHYHMYDWPDTCEELRAAMLQLTRKQIETYGKAGLDYLFYCVDGTEWISPSFFKRFIIEDTEALFKTWRSYGGFVLWHSCGKIRALLDNGYYARIAPEIMETFSEPPVGDLPSLAWARERLPGSIVTKGNMPLNILLSGTEDDVRGQVERIKTETAGYRHIVGLSDAILQGTPLANCRALVDEALHK